MIRREEVFYIGRITKMRGLRGEVELLFTDDAFDRGESDYLVLDMDGILVPYFWEEYRFKNDETAILKFADVDDEAAARRLAGHDVYYPLKSLPADEDEAGLRSLKAFTGFNVRRDTGEELGTVTAVDDSSENVLLYVTKPDGSEVILPLHDDFVADYSLTERQLVLRLPDGLLTLNA